METELRMGRAAVENLDAHLSKACQSLEALEALEYFDRIQPASFRFDFAAEPLATIPLTVPAAGCNGSIAATAAATAAIAASSASANSFTEDTATLQQGGGARRAPLVMSQNVQQVLSPLQVPLESVFDGDTEE